MNAVVTKPKATRQAFGEMLAELGASHPNVVVCDADLSKSTKSEMFGKRFPERFFQIGIAEANMIGTGAGLALSGYLPFICSFGCFVTGRYDQIRMSVAYAGAPVRIVGTHAGVGIGDDGHSQMGLEDLSLMRELPLMMVLQPCDEIETREMVKFLVEDAHAVRHPAYLRLTRQNLAAVHDSNYRFQFGRLDFLAEGSKVALLGTGAALQECVRASEGLKSHGIKPTVINVHTIKPFDQAGLVQVANSHELLITVEDHYTTGGLGSVVAESMATSALAHKTRLICLGVQDTFGESGEGPELYEKFGLSSACIERKVLEYLR